MKEYFVLVIMKEVRIFRNMLTNEIEREENGYSEPIIEDKNCFYCVSFRFSPTNINTEIYYFTVICNKKPNKIEVFDRNFNLKTFYKFKFINKIKIDDTIFNIHTLDQKIYKDDLKFIEKSLNEIKNCNSL